MFLGSTSIAAGAPASDAYHSHSKTLLPQDVSVVSPVVTALAAALSGLSVGRETSVAASLLQSTPGDNSAATQTSPPAHSRMITI